MNPPNFIPGGKERAPLVDNGVPFVLANPDQKTILWAMEHLPFEPRWSVALERKDLGRRAVTTAVVNEDPMNGHLKFQGIHRSGFGDFGPEGELSFAMDGSPDKIVFLDSRLKSKGGYQELRMGWLPELIENGYEVSEAILVNSFDPQRGLNRGGDEISGDNVTSGVVIKRDAVAVYGDPRPDYDFIMSKEQARTFFDQMAAFQASLSAPNA